MLNDAALLERAEIIREKGTDRRRFFRGQVDKYTWVDVGSSYVPSDALAAFLLGQLECEATIQANRRRVWETCHTELALWAERHGATRPTVPKDCEHSWHLYHGVDAVARAPPAAHPHLKAQDISAVFHYIPLHRATMGRRLNPAPPSLPVAESASDRLVRLPLFNDMTAAELARVLDALKACR